MALIVPYIFHGTYNFLCAFPPYYVFVIFILLVFSYLLHNNVKETQKLKKIEHEEKLFSLLILIIFTSNAFASNFWSNVKDGPYNVESAIKKYLSGRALDPIEGICLDDGLGTTVIFKDQNIYKLYIIDINYEDDKIFNRTWEASFLKR